MGFQKGNTLGPPPPKRFKGDSLATYIRARRAAQLHVYGLGNDEIAKLLACSSRTVRNYLAMPEIRDFLLRNNDDIGLLLVKDSTGIEINSKFERALRRYDDEAGVLWKQMRPRILYTAECVEAAATQPKKKRGRRNYWDDADLRTVRALWGAIKWPSFGAFVEANRTELPASILNHCLGPEVGAQRALDAARKPGRLAGRI